jgi:VanZ family protein
VLFLSTAAMLTLPGEGANNQSQWKRVGRYGPVIIWMALICYASSADFSAANTSRIVEPLFRWLFPGINNEVLASVHFLIRKCAHFSGYAVLAFFAIRAFSSSSVDLLRRRWFAATFVLVVCYALLDEFHQSFVPSRTASFYDSMIDIAGGMSFLTAYWYVRQRQRDAVVR